VAYYKLVPENRPDSVVDEVIFESDGEKKSVNVNTPVELSDEEVQSVKDLGYSLAEVEEPDQEAQQQAVGSDVVGMSPVVGESATGQPAISQGGMRRLQTPSSDIDQSGDEGNVETNNPS
jgi:hypothetical protein